MNHRPDITRNAVADHLPPVDRSGARGAARGLAATLLRIWLVFTPAILVAAEASDRTWPPILLLAVALGLSTLALARIRGRRRRRPPVANLSAASSCVWKMDVEG